MKIYRKYTIRISNRKAVMESLKKTFHTGRFFQSLIYLFVFQYSPHVLYHMPRALHRTHTAAQACGFVDDRTVIDDADRFCRTGSLADAAADTAGRADAFRFPARILVRAFYHDRVGAFMNMYDFLRTHPHAHSTGNAFFFIYFCHSVFIQCDCSKLTYRYTVAAADAAIPAEISRSCRTASVTCHNRTAIRKFFLHCHSYTFLSYGVPEIGRLNLLSLSHR